MASSIRKAQIPLPCQLCDNPTVIKWKCMDCELLMCNNCKERIHPRFKLSETHTIISIKDIGKQEGNISDRFGSLQISQPVISSHLSTYTSKFPAFHKIHYSGDKDTIYCSYRTKDNGYKFFIIHFLNESIKVLHELDIDCGDFEFGRKDEIYYGIYYGSDLNVLSSDGVTQTVLSTSPMIILGIHINKNNEIILGLREQGSIFPVTKFSTRQIALFDENKKLKFKFEYDQNGKRVFSYVYRIVTDSENNIYAIDILGNHDGRIVALERYAGIRFIYKGHSNVNISQPPFNPMDIVITKTDIIIISDEYNNSLHALNSKGDLIGLQAVKNLDIEYPLSLCLDSKGFLLIGCNTGVNVANDAKIHVAKIAL